MEARPNYCKNIDEYIADCGVPTTSYEFRELHVHFTELADALRYVCASSHPVGGLLLPLAAIGGRLTQGLVAGGVWGGQERWLLAKRQPFQRPNPVTKKGQPFNG